MGSACHIRSSDLSCARERASWLWAELEWRPDPFTHRFSTTFRCQVVVCQRAVHAAAVNAAGSYAAVFYATFRRIYRFSLPVYRRQHRSSCGCRSCMLTVWQCATEIERRGCGGVYGVMEPRNRDGTLTPPRTMGPSLLQDRSQDYITPQAPQTPRTNHTTGNGMARLI